MSSKYQKPFTIPEGFPALLKGFTREILRAQPENIYEFGARYFSELLEQRNYAAPSAPAPSAAGPSSTSNLANDIEDVVTNIDFAQLSPSELEQLLIKLFVEADADHSGYLDRVEFTHVLTSAKLNLSKQHIRDILAEADENEDDVIQYTEFVPVMVDLLKSLQAREAAAQVMEQVESEVRTEVEEMLLRGLPQDELRTMMVRVFNKADTDGSGTLSRHEFKECLKAAELGLTRRDINLILSQVDVDKDGVVSYEEFIPVCIEVLVERFKNEIVVNDILKSEDGLMSALLAAFEAADTEGANSLAPRVVKRVLREMSHEHLGLNNFQILSLMSQAPHGHDGLVQYAKFVPICAAMIRGMLDTTVMKNRLKAINKVASAGGIRALSQLDVDALRSVLEQAFMQADPDGRGYLTCDQVMDVLSNLGTLAEENGSALTESQLQTMFAAIDVDQDGTVDWSELINFLCDAIEHVEREVYLQQEVLQHAQDEE